MYEQDTPLADEPTPKPTPGFAITNRRGFHITFENGWTVSVQFGPGNYSSNYNAEFEGYRERDWQAETAEVAAWDAKGEWLEIEGDQVAGYYTPARVLALMMVCASEPAPPDDEVPSP